MGEAKATETKREANSIKHHRRKDEPVRASGREDTREGGQVGAWPWLGSVASIRGEGRSALSISPRLDLPGSTLKPHQG